MPQQSRVVAPKALWLGRCSSERAQGRVADDCVVSEGRRPFRGTRGVVSGEVGPARGPGGGGVIREVHSSRPPGTA